MKSQRQLLAAASRHFRRHVPPTAPTEPSIRTRRPFQTSATHRSGASSNPAMAFPCLDALETRSAALQANRTRTRTSSSTLSASASSSSSGPEPSYNAGTTQVYHSDTPLHLDWGGVLPSFDIAYETWGTLNAGRTNAVLLHTGLSASSHAHSTPENPSAGWWERFIGPGLSLDTDRYFVICTNVLGGCYGSTGPASVDPASVVDPGVGSAGSAGTKRYATRFPILTVEDMVRAQFRLLEHGLGISRLHAAVGSSMGGMQALAAGVLFPSRVGRVVSVSGCARSHPYSIAMRHTQRQVLMMDPNWNRGFYYDEDDSNGSSGRGGVPPHAGMKLAREIATVTYRSGPEWERRFGRRRADPSKPPALCPDFLVETYLDHAGEKWCLSYDPNSLLYVSKAMDLFDLSRRNQDATRRRRAAAAAARSDGSSSSSKSLSAEESIRCSLTLPDTPYEEQPDPEEDEQEAAGGAGSSPHPGSARPPQDLVQGLAVMRDTPTLVMGVASDILFPAWQQREVAESLRLGGNRNVTHVELSEEMSLFGHDTFLLDLQHIGSNIKNFLQ